MDDAYYYIKNKAFRDDPEKNPEKFRFTVENLPKRELMANILFKFAASIFLEKLTETSAILYGFARLSRFRY